MKLDLIDREEFDRRLDAYNELMRRKRLALEAEEAVLEDLIERYSAVLERIEAEQRTSDNSQKSREDLRTTLKELAERTSALAATL